jgi:hypothetical protein
MNWFWISMGVVGGLFYLMARGRPRRKTKVTPAKTITEQHRVKAALASEDIGAMESALEETKDPILRNQLLGQINIHYYRLRSDPESRKIFYSFASMHIEEASAVLDALSETGEERPDRYDSFRMLAIAMGEDERYDDAVDICKKALALGLENGTKTGFEGRISRLERKRANAD